MSNVIGHILQETELGAIGIGAKLKEPEEAKAKEETKTTGDSLIKSKKYKTKVTAVTAVGESLGKESEAETKAEEETFIKIKIKPPAITAKKAKILGYNVYATVAGGAAFYFVAFVPVKVSTEETSYNLTKDPSTESPEYAVTVDHSGSLVAATFAEYVLTELVVEAGPNKYNLYNAADQFLAEFEGIPSATAVEAAEANAPSTTQVDPTPDEFSPSGELGTPGTAEF